MSARLFLNNRNIITNINPCLQAAYNLVNVKDNGFLEHLDKRKQR